MVRNHVPAVRPGSPSCTRAMNPAGSGGPPFPSAACQRRLGLPGVAGGRARADPVPATSTWSWTPGSVALVCPERGAPFSRTPAATPRPARVPQVTIRHLADGGAAGLAALEVVISPHPRRTPSCSSRHPPARDTHPASLRLSLGGGRVVGHPGPLSEDAHLVSDGPQSQSPPPLEF